MQNVHTICFYPILKETKYMSSNRDSLSYFCSFFYSSVYTFASTRIGKTLYSIYIIVTYKITSIQCNTLVL